jgi:serine/threonine protein kinase
MSTTTSHLNNGPDYYPTANLCLEASRERKQSNLRYPNFKQKIFHAGDEEQFQHYRDATNGNVCIPDISLTSNLFVDQPFPEWSKYSNLRADAVTNTFRYIFYKFKKGIFVKIVENKLVVFLPFSKANYVNEWSNKIHVDKAKYGTMNDFLRRIAEAEGRRFHKRNVNDNIDEWYGNNCLVRYENPISEGESNVGNVKNMLEELCATRKVPDIELFINRRDFPILTRDGTEPYNNIWGSTNLPLVSHSYTQYVPILSMSRTNRYADMLIPTWEDWARIQSHEGKWFPRTCRDYKNVFDIKWSNKKPTAVFRGGTTGCGVTVDTNPRLKISYISATTDPDENKVPFLDAGISNWNLRPRKLQNEKFLRTIEIDKLPFGLASRLSPKEQSGYKYIVNVDGHVSAYRLSIELSMGSVVLLVTSKWKIWYSELLVPYKHYVPVREDLSDLIDQIKWCRDHDAECEQIAKNSLLFFQTYLQKNGVMDYMQKTLVDLKDEIGVYLYNVQTPLNYNIQSEYSNLDFSFPKINKDIGAIGVIPSMGRSYGLLQGFEWVIRKVIKDGNFEDIAKEHENIFTNKLGKIRQFSLAGFLMAVKTTNDSQKIREHIHEAYIGTKEINQLSKFIPNFVYILGLYRKDDTFNVVTEYIHGETLHEYINSAKFDFQEYLFIIMQLCLAIQVAQNMCGLIHYDLTPWNIMLQRLKTPMSFEYILAHNRVVRVRTSIIPVIIDYGKSHVIHDGIHHGFVNMFHVSTAQDIVTLLVTSIDQILHLHKRLQVKDFGNLIRLANFLSNTRYRPASFENAKALKEFFYRAKKYSTLISGKKYELEKYEPYDLIKHIMTMRKDYKFLLGIVKEYRPHMDKGNGRQVFEYTFSTTQEERLQSYINVFIRLKHCTLPQPKNLFFIYYAAQSLENNLVSVRDNMMFFLERNKIDSDQHEKIFEETMRFLRHVYQQKIDTLEEEDIDYTISGEFKQLILAPYTEETFLDPQKIKQLITPVKDTDLSEYKEIIELILLNRGTYQLNDKDREYYLNNFKILLNTSALNMKNNSSNSKTLSLMAEEIYKEDADKLKTIISKVKENCEDANEYLEIYNQFKTLESVKTLKS